MVQDEAKHDPIWNQNAIRNPREYQINDKVLFATASIASNDG